MSSASIVHENVETATSEFRDLLFALFNTLGGGDLKRQDTDARLFEILDHVCISHRRNDMAALTMKLINKRMADTSRRASSDKNVSFSFGHFC